MTRIKSLTHLKRILSKGSGEFFILLNCNCRSSKTIAYNKAKDMFHITNWIDGSVQDLTGKQLMSAGWTNVGVAIRKGSFYFESYG
ncbi:MAG: hypothetical protein A2252_04240 [Elusimicrobia bacterium RIFOXYA2_FULL_39_19]|nr:MAG: hypothetical protein A2252_04240 [Elusimicrobia bacterium RIFOXYA2_FULL_39_19]